MSMHPRLDNKADAFWREHIEVDEEARGPIGVMVIIVAAVLWHYDVWLPGIWPWVMGLTALDVIEAAAACYVAPERPSPPQATRPEPFNQDFPARYTTEPILLRPEARAGSHR